MITREDASKIAEADAWAHALGVEVVRVAELGERAPELYAPSLDNCWIVYIRSSALLNLPDIRSSTIIAVDRGDGQVVYRGTANAEG